MNASVEFLITISPNEHMVTMLRILAASIRLNGGERAKNARIRALVNPDGDEVSLLKQIKQIQDLGVEVVFAEKEKFAKYRYSAAGLGRICESFSSDVVILLDADTLVVGSLDELIDDCLSNNRLFGLIAHLPPWSVAENEKLWFSLFNGAGLPNPEFNCEYNGWQKYFFDESGRYCPPYFNFGVIAAPAPLIARIGEVIFSELDIVDRILPNPMRAQLALTLAISRLSIPYGCLDLRYNFPITLEPYVSNISDQALSETCIFHYLSDYEGDIKRSRDFRNLSAVMNMLNNCQNIKKLHPFINPLRIIIKQLEFPWLWRGYRLAEKINPLSPKIETEMNQVLEESAVWAREKSAENGDLDKRCLELEQECATLNSRLHDLEVLTETMRREQHLRADLEQECKRLRAHVNAFKGWVSWRITAPVRAMGRVLRFLGLRR